MIFNWSFEGWYCNDQFVTYEIKVAFCAKNGKLRLLYSAWISVWIQKYRKYADASSQKTNSSKNHQANLLSKASIARINSFTYTLMYILHNFPPTSWCLPLFVFVYFYLYCFETARIISIHLDKCSLVKRALHFLQDWYDYCMKLETSVWTFLGQETNDSKNYKSNFLQESSVFLLHILVTYFYVKHKKIVKLCWSEVEN